MREPFPCPATAQLEQLLLGQLSAPEVTSLEDHLVRCVRCSGLLGSLTPDDPLLQAVRGAADEEVAALQAQADAYTPWLKRLRHEGVTRSLSAEQSGAASGVAGPTFDFLAPPRAEAELGRLGPYIVRELLGAGGMGMVFLAYDPRLERLVALKVIRPDLLGRGHARERFLREARAVAAVEHDHIVAIHEADEENGLPYLVMPLLRGESLEDRLRRAGGPLPVDEVLRLGHQIALGLAAAHARGMIHRDIKPANLFLEGEPGPSGTGGRVKILDFGLAQALSDLPAGPPDPSKVAGTPAYMAPEQARGLAVDARADLFSLGCVLYRLAVGHNPFQAGDLLGLLLQVVEADPPPPSASNPGLPPEVERLILRLLAKKPEDRPDSAEVVAQELEALARRRAAPPRRSRWPWLVLSAAAVLVAAGLALWLRPTAAPPVPEEPAEVTFEMDESNGPIAVQRGDGPADQIDLKEGRTRRLQPGTYSIRSVAATEREMRPDVLTLRPGEKRPVELRLVGEVRQDANHTHTIWDLACAGQGPGVLVLSAENDHRVGRWKANTAERSSFLEEHRGPVQAVALTDDGRVAASGGGRPRAPDHTIRIWDVPLRAVRARLDAHRADVTALALTRDGKALLSGDAEGKLLLWDVPGKVVRKEWKGHDRRGAHAVAFSADGLHALSAGGDPRVLLWDVARGEAKELNGHTDEVRTVAFAPDGKQAASGGLDGTIRLWDLKAGSARELKAHQGGVYRLAFAPDGKQLLSAGADGVVRLWDVDSGKEVIALKGHRGTVYGVAFAADGRRAVSGGADHTLRLWELPR